MSVGRNLCHQLIDTAAALHRYAGLLDDYPEPETKLIGDACRTLADRLEQTVPPILSFEGEHRTMLPPGDPL